MTDNQIIGNIEETGNTSTTPIATTPSLFLQMLKVFAQNKLAVISLVVLVLITLFSFLGPLVYHTNQSNSSAFLGQICDQAPSSAHILGTDSTCFDMLGRLMVGGQNSLEVGFFAALFAMTFGVAYGLISGYLGGWIDSLLMRILDVLLSVPGLFILIALITLFGRSKMLLICVLGLTGWYGIARLLRAEAISLREREYAQAVKAMGGRPRRVMYKHILPNAISSIVTNGTFAIGDSILGLASLGFLGLGLTFPATDWGTILNTSQNSLLLGYWWEVFPVAIMFLLVVVSFNYIGDALRDAFEVRLRERG